MLACPCCSDKGINPSLEKRLGELEFLSTVSLEYFAGCRCDSADAKLSIYQDQDSHQLGLGAHINCNNEDAYKIIEAAIALDFTGIGIKSEGEYTTIHVDILDRDCSLFWSE